MKSLVAPSNWMETILVDTAMAGHGLEANMCSILEVRQVNELPRVLANLAEVKGVSGVSRL